MPIVDKLIHARWVLPIAPQNIILEHYSLAIQGDRIAAIIPTAQAKPNWQATEEIQLSSEHVLMPGMVNAHAHTPMNLLKGLADDLPLMQWLQHHIWPAEQAILNEESISDGAQLAILEMIRGGTTCFCDHYFFHETIAKVAIQTGMRANIGLWVGSVPTLWGANEDEYFAKVKATLDQGPSPHPLISWSLAPHAPYTVSEQAFKRLKDISAKYNIPIHIHLHETASEISGSLEKYGRRPLAYLNDLGLLSEKLIAVHMTQLTEEEIELVQKSGMSVVHCPESNLKLASGFCPVTSLLDAGITVAIGTDGAASNNDLDMLGEIQTAALLAKGSAARRQLYPLRKH